MLVVDDHEPWRRQVSSILGKSGRWQVVGEASDGLEAVHKARALAPDLILLDLELPALSGIEAARRILARDPRSRILFVSAHRSWDIVAAALGAGARGYLLKSDAGSELLPAMDAVLEGTRFLSGTFTGRSTGSLQYDRNGHRSRRHEAVLYSNSAVLLDEYAQFAAAALTAGKSIIIAADAPRQNELRRTLEADGLDIDLAIRQRRYVSVDPAGMVSTFMVDGWPDEARFWKAATSLIMEAAEASRGGRAGVAVCGDGCADLLMTGRGDAALRLEQLWDDLARTCNVDVFCGYSQTAPGDPDLFHRICREHSAVHSR